MSLLTGKTALITGATSGIGKSCAYTFASEGANLILAARRIELLEKIKSDIEKEYSVKVILIQLDVRKRKDVEHAIAALPEEWKAIDILINNAGLARGLNKINEGNIEHWEEMIDTNVKGLLYVTRMVTPLMVSRGSGHIVNIGSIAGHEVYPSGNVYCASKFAVNALTQGMRMDLVDKNIKVTTIDPGMVLTEFSKVRFSGDGEKADKVYEGMHPLSPYDIADAVLFCVSRKANVNINEIIIMPTAQASSSIKYVKK